MSDGKKSCWYPGIEKIENRWYCKGHARKKKSTLCVKLPRQEFSSLELMAVYEMIKIYESNSSIGNLTEYQDLVPRLFKEIIQHREVKLVSA